MKLFKQLQYQNQMEENDNIPLSSIPGDSDSGLMPIENLIHIIRGQQVMLDSDLARLYGVETKYLKRAVKANIKRFPSDFMFELDPAEFNSLRSQFATSNRWLSSVKCTSLQTIFYPKQDNLSPENA